MSELKHIINASSLSREQIQNYVHAASFIKNNQDDNLSQYPNKTLITMFYEPSTRTNCSFQAAAHRLGCKVIALTDKASSSEKGESLEDTIRTLGYYGDAIVLRHPAKGSAARAATVSSVPIINGGDGNGEHPTQALLDIFTIYEELMERTGRDILLQPSALLNHIPFSHEIGGHNGVNDTRAHSPLPLVITFVGDLKNSRTIHSLIRLLVVCGGPFRFIYVSPPSLEMPLEIVEYVSTLRFDQQKKTRLEDAIQDTDVLYMTRLQRERFETMEAYNAIMHNSVAYKLTPELIQPGGLAKEKMIVMHPLPRLDEIPVEIDSDDRAVYFKQVQNGLYMRMAILDRIFRS
jgi:aspartate carbamoyltransferase catalytic subunit